MSFSVPPKLYKYQSYNVQTLDNLKNRQIWFSKPVQFNDPFDCHINYDVELMKDHEWNKIYSLMKELWLKENDEKSRKSKAKYKSASHLFRPEWF